MAPYLAFATPFGPEGADPLCWSQVLELHGGLRLRLIGFNTALLAADDNDQGKLRLGKAALAQTLTGVEHGELRVVLSHHPFRGGWLADERDADAWVRNHAHVHLSGHVHEPDSEQARGGGGGSFLRISAGAAHGDRGTSGHGYSVAAIVRTTNGVLRLRLWPRRWSDKKKSFVPDSDNLPEGRPFAEHDLPVIQER